MSRRPPSALEWAAWEAPVRTALERAVLVALARDVARTSAQVQARHSELAALACLSVASVKRVLAALADRSRGIIAISTIAGSREGSIYTLVGWLKLRGVGEPDTLRVGAGTQLSVIDPPSSHRAGSPSSNGPGSISTGCTQTQVTQRPGSHRAGSLAAHYKENTYTSNGIDRSYIPNGSDESEPLDRVVVVEDVSARAQTSSRADGGLAGDAGAIVAALGHPLLDPQKAPLLVTTTRWVSGWLGLGADLDLIVETLRRVLAKHQARNGAPIQSWEFFNLAIRDAIARAKAADAAAQSPVEPSHAGDPNRPRSKPFAAERDAGLVRDQLASWARAVAAS